MSDRVEDLRAIAPDIVRFVDHFVSRQRRRRLVQILPLVIIVFAVWSMVCCIIDRWLGLSWVVRVADWIIMVSAILTLAGPAAWRLMRPFDYVEAAEAIERWDNRFAGRLVTTISVAAQPAGLRRSPEIFQAVQAETLALIRAGPTPRRPMNGEIGMFIMAGLMLSALAIGARALHESVWPLAIRQLDPLSDQGPVCAVALHLSPGDVSRLKGQPFEVTVRADGLGVIVPVLQYSLGDSPSVDALMQPSVDGFAFNFSALDQSLKYRVRAGNSFTSWYTVELSSPQPKKDFATKAAEPATRDTLRDAAVDAYFKSLRLDSK